MSDQVPGREWVHEAETLLMSLRDIAGASITLDDPGLEIAEVNILAEGQRPPKQIVRDVRSALRAEYQIDLDYRRVSVAQKRHVEASQRSPGASNGPVGPTVLSLPAAQVDEVPTVVRPRFQGVTLRMDQTHGEAQVELGMGDREVVGEARGPSVTSQVPRLVAEATLDGVSRFLEPSASLALSELQVVRLGGADVVVVAINFHKSREDKVLSGSAVVERDLQQAVVYATLSALNRVLGRLRYREPVEYELRPTTIF